MEVKHFNIAKKSIQILEKSNFKSTEDFLNSPEEDIRNIELSNVSYNKLLNYLKIAHGICIPKRNTAKDKQKIQSIILIKKFVQDIEEKDIWKNVSLAKRLIDQYGYENLINLRLPLKLYNLWYFFNPKGEKWLKDAIPKKRELVEAQAKQEIHIESDINPNDFINEKKPKNIKEFFGL